MFICPACIGSCNIYIQHLRFENQLEEKEEEAPLLLFFLLDFSREGKRKKKGKKSNELCLIRGNVFAAVMLVAWYQKVWCA